MHPKDSKSSIYGIIKFAASMKCGKIVCRGPPNVFRSCQGTSPHICSMFAARHGFVIQEQITSLERSINKRDKRIWSPEEYLFQSTGWLDMLSHHRKGKQRIGVGCKVGHRSTASLWDTYACSRMSPHLKSNLSSATGTKTSTAIDTHHSRPRSTRRVITDRPAFVVFGDIISYLDFKLCVYATILYNFLAGWANCTFLLEEVLLKEKNIVLQQGARLKCLEN